MISMKPNEETQPVSMNVSNMWSPKREIKYIKEALKKDYLYSDEELRKLKSRLRDMYIVNSQLKKGPGFGK